MVRDHCENLQKAFITDLTILIKLILFKLTSQIFIFFVNDKNSA